MVFPQQNMSRTKAENIILSLFFLEGKKEKKQHRQMHSVTEDSHNPSMLVSPLQTVASSVLERFLLAFL